MESQPQNPKFRINPENFQHCNICFKRLIFFKTYHIYFERRGFIMPCTRLCSLDDVRYKWCDVMQKLCQFSVLLTSLSNALKQ